MLDKPNTNVSVVDNIVVKPPKVKDGKDQQQEVGETEEQEIVLDIEKDALELEFSDEEPLVKKVSNVNKPELRINELDPTISIFNPNIKITDNTWAISIAKQSHESKKKDTIHNKEDDRHLDPHHAFLVLQTPSYLYRAEITPHKETPISGGYAKVSIHPPLIWYSDASFKDAVQKLLWLKENTPNTVGDVGHKTWSIPKEKALQLIKDIAMDKKNPPKFFIGGSTSVLIPEHRTIRAGSSLLAMNAAMSVTIEALNKVDPNKLMSKKAALCVLATTALASGVAAFVAAPGYDIENAASYNRAEVDSHNCATWAIAKLKNLKISEIDQSLTSYYIDKITFFTDLHVYKDSDDMKAAIADVKDKAKQVIIGMPKNVKEGINSSCTNVASHYYIRKQKLSDNVHTNSESIQEILKLKSKDARCADYINNSTNACSIL